MDQFREFVKHKKKNNKLTGCEERLSNIKNIVYNNVSMEKRIFLKVINVDFV